MIRKRRYRDSKNERLNPYFLSSSRRLTVLSQAEIKQSLGDARREFTENEKNLDHWNNEHDKLRLEEIE